MTLVNQIKKQLARFVAGEFPLAGFQQWLDQLESADDVDAAQLKNMIEWQFCDAERGLVSESGLLDNLARLASNESSGSVTPEAKVRMFVLNGEYRLASVLSQETRNTLMAQQPPSASGSFVPSQEYSIVAG
jgi:hypothetical protein